MPFGKLGMKIPCFFADSTNHKLYSDCASEMSYRHLAFEIHSPCKHDIAAIKYVERNKKKITKNIEMHMNWAIISLNQYITPICINGLIINLHYISSHIWESKILQVVSMWHDRSFGIAHI